MAGDLLPIMLDGFAQIMNGQVQLQAEVARLVEEQRLTSAALKSLQRGAGGAILAIPKVASRTGTEQSGEVEASVALRRTQSAAELSFQRQPMKKAKSLSITFSDDDAVEEYYPPADPPLASEETPMPDGYDISPSHLKPSNSSLFESEPEFSECFLPPNWPGCIDSRAFGNRISLDQAAAETSISGFTLPFHDELQQIRKSREINNCVLEPTSRARMSFDLIGVVVLMYDLLVTPVMLAWDVPLEGWLFGVTIFVVTFWTLDVCVTMRTGFYSKGDVEMNPSLIFRRYCKSTFIPDCIILLVDWLVILMAVLSPSIHSSGQMSGAKFFRLTKATRFLRLMSIARLSHMSEYFERWGNRFDATGGPFIKYLLEVFKLVAIIVWINHIGGCMWFAIGRMDTSDTGESWLRVPIGRSERVYEETSELYQYTTSFHWAITQMTPGSLQVFPTNSIERLFNIFALVFGMLFFSSLISSLSATLVNFRMRNAKTNAQLAELRKFLRSSGISTRVSMSVQKQAAERLTTPKPLTIADISALNVLSQTLRAELQFELCAPSVLQFPFYRVCQTLDAAILKKTLVSCIDFTVTSPGDILFLSGAPGTTAFLVSSGKLDYVQVPQFSKVFEQTTKAVDVSRIICEPAIWSHWTYVGTGIASVITSLLAIDVEKHSMLLSSNELIRRLACEYARGYQLRLAAARPPQAHWPTDLEVELATFEEIISSSRASVRRIVSMTGLECLRTQEAMVATPPFLATKFGWGGPKHLEELEQEVGEGRCILIANNEAVVERTVAVAALQVVNCRGFFLTQLGTWDSKGGLKAGCKLPGTKQNPGETPMEALKRVISKELQPLEDRIDLSSSSARLETVISHSEKYNLQSKYLRTVYTAQFAEAGNTDMDNLGIRFRRRRVFGRVESGLGQLGNLEVFGLLDKKQLLLFAWLEEKDMEYFRDTSEGQHDLKGKLGVLQLDENMKVNVSDGLAQLSQQRQAEKEDTLQAATSSDGADEHLRLASESAQCLGSSAGLLQGSGQTVILV
ncbi:unnamed protein product [Polarella glacialis]|uniref:Cyclic nucleotide-binding domain-containing protein n=1 Tax=Polarella glacialis TaxID=89957 RepID=A0A813JYU1_POLGL|nr:unnamed protein product [Polarella glacialis]